MLNDDPKLSCIHHYHHRNHCGDDNVGCSTVLVVLFPLVVGSQPQQHNTHHEWAPAVVPQFGRFTECEISVEGGCTRKEVVQTTVLVHPVYVRPAPCLSSRSMVSRLIQWIGLLPCQSCDICMNTAGIILGTVKE